ncbi:hypothetical protein D3C78_1721830 [compost metagenome]
MDKLEWRIRVHDAGQAANIALRAFVAVVEAIVACSDKYERSDEFSLRAPS